MENGRLERPFFLPALQQLPRQSNLPPTPVIIGDWPAMASRDETEPMSLFP
jgi:hypothetical protein